MKNAQKVIPLEERKEWQRARKYARRGNLLSQHESDIFWAEVRQHLEDCDHEAVRNALSKRVTTSDMRRIRIRLAHVRYLITGKPKTGKE